MAFNGCNGASELKKRIVIQTNTPTQDAYGGDSNSWSTLATVWAGVEYRQGTEKYEGDGDAKEERGIEKAIFKIRYRTDITAKERISFRSKFWDIRNIRIDNDQWLHIDAETRDI